MVSHSSLTKNKINMHIVRKENQEWEHKLNINNLHKISHAVFETLYWNPKGGSYALAVVNIWMLKFD